MSCLGRVAASLLVVCAVLGPAYSQSTQPIMPPRMEIAPGIAECRACALSTPPTASASSEAPAAHRAAGPSLAAPPGDSDCLALACSDPARDRLLRAGFGDPAVTTHDLVELQDYMRQAAKDRLGEAVENETRRAATTPTPESTPAPIPRTTSDDFGSILCFLYPDSCILARNPRHKELPVAVMPSIYRLPPSPAPTPQP